MSRDSARLRVRSVKFLVLAALFAAGLVQGLRFHPADRAVFADDQLYFYVAERAASGVPPHVSLVDHKHQLTPLVSGAAIAIGRIFGADDVLAGRVPSILLAAAVVPLLCMLGEGLTGSFAAGLVAAACALTFKMFFIEAATGFRPQLFMTFFAVAALVAYARGSRAGAGALAAGSFLCWQPAVVVGAALVAAAIFEERRWGSVRRIVLGGALVLLAYEAYFALNGALGEQLYQSYLMGKRLRIPPLSNTIVFFVRGDATELRWRPDALFSGMLLVMMAGAWLWALARPRAAWSAWKSSPGGRAVLVAAHGAVLFTFLDHQAYPDRFFVLPYAALAAACLVALVPRRLGRVPLRTPVTLAISLWTISFAPNLVRASNLSGSTLEDQRTVAHRLVEISELRGGGLWVVGRPDLLAFDRKANWNAFGMLLDEHVREYARRTDESRGAYRPVRDGNMPEMVFVARLEVREWLPWLFSEYDKVVLPEFASLHGQLFVKKSTLLSPARAVSSEQCGDPIGDRFRIGGVDLGRPPTATDALYVLRAVLQGTPCNPCICDIDGDGLADATDALWLLKIAAGADLPLKCPPCTPGPNERQFRASQAASRPAPAARKAVGRGTAGRAAKERVR